MKPHFTVAEIVKRFGRDYTGGSGKTYDFKEVEMGYAIALEGIPFAIQVPEPHSSPLNIKPGDKLVLMRLNDRGEPEPIAVPAKPYTPTPHDAALIHVNGLISEEKRAKVQAFADQLMRGDGGDFFPNGKPEEPPPGYDRV